MRCCEHVWLCMCGSVCVVLIILLLLLLLLLLLSAQANSLEKASTKVEGHRELAAK